MIKLPRYTQPAKFLRVSKYLFPADWSALSLNCSLTTAPLKSVHELLKQYPTQVRQFDLGVDSDWGGFEAELILDSRFVNHRIASDAPIQLSVATFQQFSTAGRDCRVIAPHGNFVQERGYDLERTHVEESTLAQRLSPRYWRRQMKSIAAAHRSVPLAQSLPGTVAVLNNRSPHNFYHWLLEVVPRIALMQRAGIESDWYLLDSQCSYQRRVLSLLNIDMEKVIQPHYALNLRPDVLVRPSEPGVIATLEFANKIRSAVDSLQNDETPRRIYISRRSAAHRKLANEAELERLLDRFGFTTVEFESLDFAEQVRMVSRAEAIIAVHGAALANLIFAKAGTPVIEICPRSRYNLDCFPRVSHIRGLRHLSILSDSSGRRQSIRVNPSDVRMAMERLGIMPS
jgi:Glycosyltransferase 61